jgi:hypothetical protein
MGLPQFIMISLMALSLGITLALHGKPRTPHDITPNLIGQALTVTLLWWGGFFHPCH